MYNDTITDENCKVNNTHSRNLLENLTPENIALYRDIFKGRQDIAPVYWKSKRDGNNGYSLECSNKWDAELCNLKRKVRGGCGTCKNADYTPWSDGLVERHLNGGAILGVYPLLENGTCHFIAADFDKHKPEDPDPWDDVKRYLDTCEVQEIPAYALKSKSGNGYHVYIFFSEAVDAWKARAMAFFILGEAGIIGDDVELSTFDRLFPNQAKSSGKGFGNLISLPFQGSAACLGNTLFLNPITDYQTPCPDQWETLATLNKITPDTLDAFIKEWELTEEKPPAREGAKDFKPIIEQTPLGVFSRVKAGCPFMAHWCQDSEKLPEPEWYAGLTIIARCKDGRRLAHKYSADHIGYDVTATDLKIEHALTDTGPYLCKTIQDQINGKYCGKCSHRGKISTPIRLGEQMALDDFYLETLKAMNKEHGVIAIGGKCHILNEVIDPTFNKPDITLSSPTDFRNFYANQKIQDPNKPEKEITKAQWWFEHPDRRQYKGITFDPSNKTGPDYYNLWRGLGVEPVAGDWSLFRELIFDVIAGGKQSIYEWVVAWLARIVQDPGGQRPGTAIVLRGKQGTGKGVFANTFGQILGRHFLQIAQASQITGRFNHHLKDAVLVFVDEGFWAGDKQGEGAIKNMITEPFITLEQKGKDLIRVPNHVNLVMASNNDWVIPAGLEERRFFVLDVSDKHQQDKPFFKALVNQMENGGVEAMLYDLLRLDISGVDLRTFEQTKGLFEQKLYSMTTVQKYWYERLMDGNLRTTGDGATKYGSYRSTEWGGEVISDDQYQDYLAFSKTMNDYRPLCETQFALSLQKMCKDVKKVRPRVKGERIYMRVFPDLDKCRKEFEEAVKMEIEWGNDDE